MVRFVVATAVAACPQGCAPDRVAAPCESDVDCQLEPSGRCLVSPSGTNACAYPDGDCPGGYHWGELAGGIAGECAFASDAGAIDASVSDGLDGPRPAFDIAYASEWRISVENKVGGFVQIINTSQVGLRLDSLALTGLSDDHPTATVRITATPSSAILGLRIAGGKLFPNAAALLAPLVPEVRGDEDSSYLTLEVLGAPQGTYDIHVTATVMLDGVVATLPMTIHIVPLPVVWFDPVAAARLQFYR